MPLLDDPEVSLGAVRWLVDQAYRPDDVVHIVHVVKCLVQKLEVYHGESTIFFCIKKMLCIDRLVHTNALFVASSDCSM
jgi:hypothetical protein